MKKENTVNTFPSETIIVLKKRGRKSKKDIEEINKGINNEFNNEFNKEINKEIIKENINIVIEFIYILVGGVLTETVIVIRAEY
jgi:hypothetical protein